MLSQTHKYETAICIQTVTDTCNTYIWVKCPFFFAWDPIPVSNFPKSQRTITWPMKPIKTKVLLCLIKVFLYLRARMRRPQPSFYFSRPFFWVCNGQCAGLRRLFDAVFTECKAVLFSRSLRSCREASETFRFSQGLLWGWKTKVFCSTGETYFEGRQKWAMGIYFANLEMGYTLGISHGIRERPLMVFFTTRFSRLLEFCCSKI